MSAMCPRLWRLAPGPPGDLARGEDQEDGEELAERGFRQGFRDLRAADRSADGGEADHDRRPPADVSVALVAPDPDEDGRDDREQRGRLRVELGEPEVG